MAQLVLQPIGPMAHWSYGLLVLRPIGPRTNRWKFPPLWARNGYLGGCRGCLVWPPVLAWVPPEQNSTKQKLFCGEGAECDCHCRAPQGDGTGAPVRWLSSPEHQKPRETWQHPWRNGPCGRSVTYQMESEIMNRRIPNTKPVSYECHMTMTPRVSHRNCKSSTTCSVTHSMNMTRKSRCTVMWHSHTTQSHMNVTMTQHHTGMWLSIMWVWVWLWQWPWHSITQVRSTVMLVWPTVTVMVRRLCLTGGEVLVTLSIGITNEDTVGARVEDKHFQERPGQVCSQLTNRDSGLGSRGGSLRACLKVTSVLYHPTRWEGGSRASGLTRKAAIWALYKRIKSISGTSKIESISSHQLCFQKI